MTLFSPTPREVFKIVMFLERDSLIFKKLQLLKQYFHKVKPKVVNYRDYRNFRNKEFRAQLDNEILKHDISNMEYQHFLNIFIGLYKYPI